MEYVFMTKNGKPLLHNGELTMTRYEALEKLERARKKTAEYCKLWGLNLSDLFASVNANGYVHAMAKGDIYEIQPITLHANTNRRYGNGLSHQTKR